FQFRKPVDARGQLLCRRTAHGNGTVACRSRCGHAQCLRSPGREHRELRARIDESVYHAAVATHRKKQVVAWRSTGVDPGIGCGPSGSRPGTSLLCVKNQAMTRQVEIDVKAS